MAKRLCNKGRANLLTAISEYSICIKCGIDSRYEDFKVCNYYCTYIGLTRL